MNPIIYTTVISLLFTGLNAFIVVLTFRRNSRKETREELYQIINSEQERKELLQEQEIRKLVNENIKELKQELHRMTEHSHELEKKFLILENNYGHIMETLGELKGLLSKNLNAGRNKDA